MKGFLHQVELEISVNANATNERHASNKRWNAKAATGVTCIDYVALIEEIVGIQLRCPGAVGRGELHRHVGDPARWPSRR